MNINWYPGHMAKTRRLITENLKLVDAVAEIIDARIPVSSRNPDLDELAGHKPRLIILNRADQADPDKTAKWLTYFSGIGAEAFDCSSKSGAGTNRFIPAVKNLLREKIERLREKGQSGRTLRLMIVGIPNVGKSSFVNRLAGRAVARAEDRPGVTRGKQWISLDKGIELLDTPGILWPNISDPRAGQFLAYTGAIKDNIMDVEELSCNFLDTMSALYPQSLTERYKIPVSAGIAGYDLLESAARSRGFLMSGGHVDTERMSRILFDEFRGGKLGRFTLESVDDFISSGNAKNGVVND